MKFLVLPDNEDGAAVAGGLHGREWDKVLPHESGRPWLVGSWNDGDVLTASCGSRRIALAGCFRATSRDLGRALERITAVENLDPVLRSMPGSHHAIASFGGRIRVQGSLSGIHEVFHATINGVTVAADRPDTLAALAGHDIDEAALTCHLIGQQPWPLSDRTLWRGVECLEPGHYLRVHPDGKRRSVRWWTPPPPELPRDQGAARVRIALQDAVTARAREGSPLGCDLSGGMDSTSLAFLAGREKRCGRLVTVRREAEDPGNDDAAWATRAAESLPAAEHVVLPVSQGPQSFAGQLSYDDDLEAPYPWSRTKAQAAYIAEQLAVRGVSTHITGHGGDELFSPAPSFYHSLARSSPLRSISLLRDARSMYRWPLGAMLRNLLRAPSYPQWLEAASSTVSKPVGGPREPVAGWGFSPRLPPWATAAAVATFRDLLRDAAERGVAPHSSAPAQHVVVQAARQCGRKIRLTGRLTSRVGVASHAPYLDDQVLEAALSVRVVDRYDSRQAKPVLAAALRGSAPEWFLGRTTKGEFSAEVYAGVRRHKRELLELGEDMRLARLGLVDGAAVRATLLAPHPMSRTFIPVVDTLACESWLRSVEVARTRARGLEGTR